MSACLRKSSFARIASARDLLVLLRAALEHVTVAGNEDPERRSSSSMRVSRPASVRPSAPPPSNAPPPVTLGPRSASAVRRSDCGGADERVVAAAPVGEHAAFGRPVVALFRLDTRCAGSRANQGYRRARLVSWFAEVYGEPFLAASSSSPRPS